MTQKPYLIRFERVMQADLRGVSYQSIYKRVGVVDLGPLGKIPHSVSTGKVDKGKLLISPDAGCCFSIAAKPDDIKRRMRRLRPTEAELLDEIDVEIEALREKRKELLKTAWQEAHVVTIKELLEKI